MRYIILVLCFIPVLLTAQITVNTNFRPNIAQPLDIRQTLPTLADTSTVSFVYDGLISYVESLNQFYFYQDYWQPFLLSGSGVDTFYLDGDTLRLETTTENYAVFIGNSSGIDDFYRDGDTLRIVAGVDTFSVSSVEPDSAVYATLTTLVDTAAAIRADFPSVSGVPAGSNTQIQYNNQNVFGATEKMTYTPWEGVTSNVSSPDRITVGDTTYTIDDKIIWYGNSITRGSQANPDFTFPRLVSYGLNCTPDIRAIDGTGLYGTPCSDSSMVCRLYGVPNYSTDVRYICFLYGPQGSSLDTIVDYSAYRAAYYQVIDSIEAKGYPTEKIVILSWVHTTVPGADFINPIIVSLQDSIASERGVNFVNTYQAMLDNGGDDLVADDNIHTNTAGHSIIAQAFFDSLGLRTAGYLYAHGNVDIKGNLNVEGGSTFAGGANFAGALAAGARLTSRASVSDATGIEMISNQPGSGNKSWIELKHTLSSDIWRLTQTVGTAYVNTFSIDHNTTQMLGFSNDNKMSLFGSASPSSLLGTRFTLYGDMQMTERLSIWGRPTYNNRSLLDLRNPQFAGSSYIEMRMFAATSTDTMRIRNQIISGSESLFGFMRNNNYIYMYRGDTGNTTIGSNTDQGYKLAVVGVTGLSSEKSTIRSSTNNRSILDIRNPTFGVNSYVEQKFWTQGTTDTLRIRQIVVSGGDQHLRLMRNNDVAVNVGSNGGGLTGVGIGGITTTTAKLHIGAGTATLNTAPLKFTPGTNLTTPEVGAVEFDGTSLFYTITGPTRRRLLDLPTSTPTTNHIPIWNGTAWVTAAAPSGATNLSFSGSTSPVSLLSDTGADVVFAAGTGIELSQSADTLTISATGLGGIYTGSGDIPMGTVATLEEEGDFSINWFYSGAPQPYAFKLDETTKAINLYSDGGNIEANAQNVAFLTLSSSGLIGLSNTGFDFSMSPTDAVFVDSYHGEGLKYDVDYSSTFVDRSLVDKAYVDNNDNHFGNTNLTLTGNRTHSGDNYGTTLSNFGYFNILTDSVQTYFSDTAYTTVVPAVIGTNLTSYGWVFQEVKSGWSFNNSYSWGSSADAPGGFDVGVYSNITMTSYGADVEIVGQGILIGGDDNVSISAALSGSLSIGDASVNSGSVTLYSLDAKNIIMENLGTGFTRIASNDNIFRVTKDSTSIVTPDPFNISAGFSTHKYYSGLSLEGSDLTGLFTATVNFEGDDVGLVANDVLSLNAASGGSASFGATGEGALEIGVTGTNSGQPTLSAVTGPVYVEAERLIVDGELRVTDLTSGTPVDAVGVDADGDLVTMPFTSDQLTLVSTWTNLTGSELTAYKQGSRVTIQGVIKGVVIPSAGPTDICTTLPTGYRLTLGGFQAFAVVDGTLYPCAVQMILGNVSVQSLSGANIDLTGADDYLIIQNTYYKN